MDTVAMGGAATNPKSESSSAGGGAGKTVEEMRARKTQLEHILFRPDTYLGYTYYHTTRLWVYEHGGMVQRDVTYIPGLYKIFDDILLSAADNKRRDPSAMDSLKVDIDVHEGRISVYSNGHGLPVEIHQEEGVYVPEVIYGTLLIGRGWDYGVKLANVFSTEFVVETADGRRHQKKYKQGFSENMRKKSEPEIKECKQSDNWTRITFRPDLAKFYMTHLEKDIAALMRKRVVDMAGILGETVRVELNGEKVATRS